MREELQRSEGQAADQLLALALARTGKRAEKKQRAPDRRVGGERRSGTDPRVPRKAQSRFSAAATIDGPVPIAGNTPADTFPLGHVSADGQSRLRQALRE